MKLKLYLNRYAMVLLIAAFASPASAQTLATGSSVDPPLFRIVVGLILCVFLAYSIILTLKRSKRQSLQGSSLGLFRKLGAGAEERQVAILETHRLNANSDICLIAYNRKNYLVILGPDGAHVLDESSEETFQRVLDGKSHE